jgi:ATP:corrinoid adenosyltransferase
MEQQQEEDQQQQQQAEEIEQVQFSKQHQQTRRIFQVTEGHHSSKTAAKYGMNFKRFSNFFRSAIYEVRPLYYC